MRLLVYEYLSSGAVANRSIAPSLRREGLTMFRAIVEDLAQCPGVQLLATLDPSLLAENQSWPSNFTAFRVDGPAEDAAMLDCLAQQVDAALVIAPEFGDLLGQRCHRLEELGVSFLGPSSAAVRNRGQVAAGTSLATGWSRNATLLFSSISLLPMRDKTASRAGSQATFFLRDATDLQRAQDLATEFPGEEMVCQPFVPGRPASVSFLLGTHDRLVLPAAWQLLSNDGRFHYLGGQLPLPSALNRRAQQLATAGIDAVPGLRGYVGVDLILGEADDGSEDRAIEINPRLTTSYVGLRALADFNLAWTMLALLGVLEQQPEERWKPGPLRFWPDGTLDDKVTR